MMVPHVASMLLNFLIIPQKTVGSNPDGQGSPLLLFRCAGFCTYRETLIKDGNYDDFERCSGV